MVERKMTLSEEEREREALVVLSALAAGLVAAILWVVHTRLVHYECAVDRDVAVASAGLLLGAFGGALPCHSQRAPCRSCGRGQLRVIRPDRDRKYLAEAAANDAVLVGYRTNGTPFYWSNQLRSMQAICFGQTGAGKSTLLESHYPTGYRPRLSDHYHGWQRRTGASPKPLAGHTRGWKNAPASPD